MSTMTRRWLARASFALMFGAVALLLGVAGWRSLALVAFAAIGGCAVVAGGYWFLANRGVVRWLALVLVVAAPVVIVVAFAWHHLLWVAVLAVALMVAAAGTARAALGTGGQDAAMPARPAARPRRPFLIMNPRSGGGTNRPARSRSASIPQQGRPRQLPGSARNGPATPPRGQAPAPPATRPAAAAQRTRSGRHETSAESAFPDSSLLAMNPRAGLRASRRR